MTDYALPRPPRKIPPPEDGFARLAELLTTLAGEVAQARTVVRRRDRYATKRAVEALLEAAFRVRARWRLLDAQITDAEGNT